jgi:hypothetical protein
MAKQPPKDEGRKYYTATVDVEGKRPGYPESRSVAFPAVNEQEVRDRLTAEGWKWKRITITEGRCIVDLPSRKDADAERYHAELENMLGHGFPPRYNSGPVAYPAPGPPKVKDTTARKSWAKYMEEWSHGLSVSALPQYLDVDMGGTVPLPARLVQDAERWPYCTAIVEAQVAQWRARRAHMAEHRKGNRSPKARELRKDDMEAVKSFDALKGWTFQAMVDGIVASPSPFDIPNPRLFHIPTGYMVPTMDPDREHLKVEFWRHLLAAWDGPANTRAEVVRSMLDHHHGQGGRPEVFRELVRDTCTRLKALEAKEENQRTNEQLGPRIRNASRWQGLAVTLEQWLEEARNAPTSAKSPANAKAMPTAPIRLRSLAERLDAVPGAREAFDTMLRMDGLTNDAGHYVLKSRKGKGGVLAAWDAIVQHFGVEGFGKDDAALSDALMGYIDGFKVQRRIGKLRGHNIYRDAFREWPDWLDSEYPKDKR